MINDKAILVGVDGSHASYKATWWAANYAKHAGLTLQIVCAYSLPSRRFVRCHLHGDGGR